MNNPVMYSDPDGEFIIVDSWIIGFLSKLVETGSLKQSWDEANKRAVNDARIWGGLFVSDPNKNFWGRSLEVVSRLIWQLPQTVAGWGFSQSCNTFGFYGGVETVEYRYGATVVQTNSNNYTYLKTVTYTFRLRQLQGMHTSYIRQIGSKPVL